MCIVNQETRHVYLPPHASCSREEHKWQCMPSNGKKEREKQLILHTVHRVSDSLHFTYSSSIRTSLSSTVSPTFTLMAFTVPSARAWILFRIFIASRVSSSSPATTFWPA